MPLFISQVIDLFAFYQLIIDSIILFLTGTFLSVYFNKFIFYSIILFSSGTF